jgi:hypothetical protein
VSLSNSPETGLDSSVVVLPSTSEGRHGVEPLQLSEQASTSYFTSPCSPSPRPSSEQFHDSTSTRSLHTSHTRSKAATSNSPPRSQSPQLSQEDHLHIGQSTLDEHELVGYTLDTFAEEKEEPDQRTEERETGVAQDTEAVYDALHPGSPVLPGISRDTQAMCVIDGVKQDRLNASATSPASAFSSVTKPVRPSPSDPHSLFAELVKSMPPSARNHSPSPHRSSVFPQIPTDQQDQNGIIYSGSEELQHISPLKALGNGEQNQQKCKKGDRRGEPHQAEDRVALSGMAKSSGGTNILSKAGGSPRAAKRQRLSPYYNPEPDQDERGNGTNNSRNDECNSAQSDEDDTPRPLKQQRSSPSCKGSTRKPECHLQQSSRDPPRSQRPKPQRRSCKPRSPLDKETAVAVGPIYLQSGMITATSLLEDQHRECQTRRGGQSSGTSVDGRLASTARTTPAASESAPLTDPAVAA